MFVKGRLVPARRPKSGRNWPSSPGIGRNHAAKYGRGRSKSIQGRFGIELGSTCGKPTVVSPNGVGAAGASSYPDLFGRRQMHTHDPTKSCATTPHQDARLKDGGPGRNKAKALSAPCAALADGRSNASHGQREGPTATSAEHDAPARSLHGGCGRSAARTRVDPGSGSTWGRTPADSLERRASGSHRECVGGWRQRRPLGPTSRKAPAF